MKSMATDELINQLTYNAVLAFCVGFIAGVFLALMVFIVETPDFYKKVFVSVFIIVLLFAFWGFIKHLRDIVIPEFKKGCKD